MAEDSDKDQKTEDPTPKKRQDAVKQGDILQSRDLATALVIIAGAAWFALAGPWMVGALAQMMRQALSFDVGAIEDFDPARTAQDLVWGIALPLASLFGLTIAAAIAGPALLGSLGFRSGAFGFKASKINPMAGMKRIFGTQGLTELIKSIAKIVVLGAIGVWLLMSRAEELVQLGSRDIVAAIGEVGDIFLAAVMVMALGLAALALFDVPTQLIQRLGRLRMTKQEVRDEHKQTEGSPELKAQIRRRQHEVLRSSARAAVAEATVVLTNPTHFAVALRYRPDEDAAPTVVARGNDETAQAIRDLADDHAVPILRYPELTRALYYTTRAGQPIREDLYLAVATVLAFVFNLDASLSGDPIQPEVAVPPGARFDAEGRPEAP